MIIILAFVASITINSEAVLVSRLAAEAKCSGNGGLIKYDRFKEEDFPTADLFLELQDGESFWLDGFAQESLTMSLYGCFEKFSGIQIRKAKLPDKCNALIACSEECMKHSTHNYDANFYMGLQGEICFCFVTEQLNNYQIDASLKDCQKECSLAPQYECNVDSDIQKITVYTIHTSFSENYFPTQQCDGISTATGNEVWFSHLSCYHHTANFSGIVCILPEIKPECPAPIEINGLHYCLYNSTIFHQFNWRAALQHCINNSGRLFEIADDDVMSPGTFYWTGQFRPLSPNSHECKALGKTYPSTDICIVATKLNSTFLLESTSCVHRHQKFICADDSRLKASEDNTILTQDVSEPTTKDTIGTYVVAAIVSGAVCFILGGFAGTIYMSRNQRRSTNGNLTNESSLAVCGAEISPGGHGAEISKGGRGAEVLLPNQGAAVSLDNTNTDVTEYERLDEYTELDDALRDNMSAYDIVQK